MTVDGEEGVTNQWQHCLILQKKNLFFKLKAPFQGVSWAVSFQVFHDSKESQGQKRKDGFFGNATSQELRSPISSSSRQRLPVDSFGTLERAGQWDTPH